jgi:7-keto-8-aminopelargonate synthetase-like enzyme
MEIGSFSKYLGGYGTYLGAKKYLTNKIIESTDGVYAPIPKFMLAVNVAGIEILKNESKNRTLSSKLWTHSRFFINRLKQIGFKTVSETPIIVIIFNNNNEAETFSRYLLEDGILVNVNKERVRMVLSIEHSRNDLDYALDRIEAHYKDMGIVYPSVKSSVDLST